MAMYHFRIKSDKKPNGTKISAVQHVEYINREGKFSTPEQWREKNKFVGNYITTEKSSNVFSGQNLLLYKTDDYGSIRNTARGIEVTEKATEETIAIALVLAAKTMEKQPLILHGTDKFKEAALKVAIRKDLPISFYDLSYQRDFIHNKIGGLSGAKKLRSTYCSKNLGRCGEEKANASRIAFAVHQPRRSVFKSRSLYLPCPSFAEMGER